MKRRGFIEEKTRNSWTGHQECDLTRRIQQCLSLNRNEQERNYKLGICWQRQPKGVTWASFMSLSDGMGIAIASRANASRKSTKVS